MFRPAVGSVREGGQVPGAAPPDHFIQKTAAACDAAGRVRGTRPCANAQSFENIEPCKTAAGAVLLWPLRGAMV